MDDAGTGRFDRDVEPDSLTSGVNRWLQELSGGDRAPENMPHAVLSVAGRALRTATAEIPGEVAFARVLSSAGRWIVLHGAVLQSGGRRRVAVIIEPAHPARISPLLWPPTHSQTENSKSPASC